VIEPVALVETPPEATRPGADLAWRVAGAVVGVAGGLVTALIAALYVPLYAGTIRLPISPVIAIVANVTLVWFTYRVTDHKGASLLPGLVWMGVLIVAAGRTTEGDLLLVGDNWVGLTTILAGVLAYTMSAVRLLGRRPGLAKTPPER
jgi:hypothetical protein